MSTPAKLSDPQSPPAEMWRLSSDELRRMLAQSIKRTAEELMRLAWIVRILEERGEDLSDLKLGLLGWLRQIAYGQVVPEAVVRFAASPKLMKAIASLPRPDQMRLASGEPLQLTVQAGGEYSTRLVDPLKLSAAQVQQVFAEDHVRDHEEQVLKLESGPAPRPKARARKPTATVRVDPDGRGLMVNQTLVPTGKIVELLSELAHGPMSEEFDDSERRTFTFELSGQEHYSLKKSAREADMSMGPLVRQTLRAAGLFIHPMPEEES